MTDVLSLSKHFLLAALDTAIIVLQPPPVHSKTSIFAAGRPEPSAPSCCSASGLLQVFAALTSKRLPRNTDFLLSAHVQLADLFSLMA